jgi:hypothetical protein
LNGPTDGEPPTVIEDEEDQISGNDSADLLQWHHRLNHIMIHKVQTMAKWGLLPKQLSACEIPVCTSCMFGKAIQKPWWTKPTKAINPKTVTAPGQCVSVDQMESTTPGFIAQLRRRPTMARYKVATLFVDQFSGLGYVHLQKGTQEHWRQSQRKRLSKHTHKNMEYEFATTTPTMVYSLTIYPLKQSTKQDRPSLIVESMRIG